MPATKHVVDREAGDDAIALDPTPRLRTVFSRRRPRWFRFRRPRSSQRNVPFTAGDRIGCYQVISRLAHDTYRAERIGSQGGVLIEVAGQDNVPEAAVRMLRAQRVVDSVDHPGAARIVDRGVLADRRPWMATALPDGPELSDVIALHTMSARSVTALVRDVAEVLACAHARGIVHHALAPHSIVLASEPRGFPIAIASWGVLAEVASYSAPELSTGRSCNGRADVYSLGVIAFRAVTGKFPGDDGVYGVGGVPPELATLIEHMLAIDPFERLTSIEVCSRAAELLVSEPWSSVLQR